MDSQFYRPLVVSEQGYIQERLTLPMINRIRSRTPVGLEGSNFSYVSPSPPTGRRRSEVQAAARARLERLVLERHAARTRKCERQGEAGRGAVESVPAPPRSPRQHGEPSLSRARSVDDAMANGTTGDDSPPTDSHSPTSVLSPHVLCTTRPDEGSVKSPRAAKRRVKSQWQHAALADGSPGRLRLPRISKERLRRLSGELVAEQYLAGGVGRLASQGA